jgi:hypothetical protein
MPMIALFSLLYRDHSVCCNNWKIVVESEVTTTHKRGKDPQSTIPELRQWRNLPADTGGYYINHRVNP